ncbi:hypothetical protein P9112_014289 [Eukaryota sp. TZLM1-RC]
MAQTARISCIKEPLLKETLSLNNFGSDDRGDVYCDWIDNSEAIVDCVSCNVANDTLVHRRKLNPVTALDLKAKEKHRKYDKDIEEANDDRNTQLVIAFPFSINNRLSAEPETVLNDFQKMVQEKTMKRFDVFLWRSRIPFAIINRLPRFFNRIREALARQQADQDFVEEILFKTFIVILLLSSLFHHPENISDLLNDEFFDLCGQLDIRNNELRDIFENLIEPFTCQIENLVTDENLVDNIFPVDMQFLADVVEKDPQIFLKPAITIAQYISSREKKPYHNSPVSTTVGPGYFSIDTRTIKTIIRQTLMDDLLPDQRIKMVNTQAQITKFKPPEQFDFWSNILDLNQPMFKKKSNRFNKIKHTDGFILAVEFVR